MDPRKKMMILYAAFRSICCERPRYPAAINVLFEFQKAKGTEQPAMSMPLRTEKRRLWN